MKRPLVWAAAGLAFGILGESAIAGVAAAGLGAACAAAGMRLSTRRDLLWAGVVALLWFSAGSLRAHATFTRLACDHFARHAASSGPLRFSAILEEEPRVLDPAPGGRPGCAAVARMTRLRPEGGEILVSGRVRLFLPSRSDLAEGAEVQGTGRLTYPAPPANPGEPDLATMGRRAGIRAVISMAASDVEEVVPPPEAGSARTWLLGAVSRAIDAHAPQETSAFLKALLLGIRGELPGEMSDAFVETGTVHFLAVSGLHLVFLLGPLAATLRIIAVSVPIRAVLLIGGAWAYAWLVGFAPSVTRAAVLATALLGSDLVRRPRDAASALALAFTAILLISPHQLYLPGFQLSFLACLGIVFLRVAPARERDKETLVRPRGALGSTTRAAGQWLRDAAAVSLAAWIATAPVVLMHFHIVTPITVAANLILSPFFCAVLLGGFTLAGASALNLSGAETLATGLDACVQIISSLAGMLAQVPAGHVYLPAPLAAGVFAFLALLFLGFGRADRALSSAARRGRFLAAALAVFLAVVWGSFLWVGKPIPGFVVLDVRQGLCSFLVTDDGRTAMYDCGAYGGRDPTPLAVAPALWERGVRRIDLLVLSHPHADHASGVASLLRRFPVGEVVTSPQFESVPAGRVVLEMIRRAGAACRSASAGDLLPLGSSAWSLEVLHPPLAVGFNPVRQANDLSLVVRAVRGSPSGTVLRARGFVDGIERRILAPGEPVHLLWTGDLEDRGAEIFLARPAEQIEAAVVAIPHHGSAMEKAADLARAARPRLAVNSARPGFASPEVLKAYRDAGAEVLETCRSGAVIVEWH